MESIEYVTPLRSSDEGQYKCPSTGPPGSYRYIFPIPWRFLWIYLCFFICMFFDLYSISNVFLLRVDRFSFDSGTWILISRRSDLSGDCVQDAWSRFYPPQSWKPFSQQKLFVPESSNKSILYRQIFVPSEKRILVLENPKTDLPNSNQSTKIAYSNLRTFC